MPFRAPLILTVDFQRRVVQIGSVDNVATSVPTIGSAVRENAARVPVARRNRELKIETFSGRRRPDWQSNPGTEVAVASLQNSNIKIAVNSGGRRRGRLPKRKI